MRVCIDLFELGIAFMHSKGVVHSDLKPSNLLFNESNTIQIADFGQLHLLQLHLSYALFEV
jgi:serine/threonine protein kinase